MPAELTGRLVDVRTRFHSEAVRPGGVGRRGAIKAAAQSVAGMDAQLRVQVADNLEPLVALLRDWTPEGAEQGCIRAVAVRDVAGLVGQNLLTEVAMYCNDCLDSIVTDGAQMDGVEAACYADALIFASLESSRGEDLTPYGALLRELDALTSLVAGRGKAE